MQNGPNRWVINNSYNGLGVYQNTFPQDSTFAGTIDLAPFSKYLHISDFYSSATNANFNPDSASDNFAVFSQGVCTWGFINVAFSFYYLCEGSPLGHAEVYYRKNGGAWNQIGLPQYDNSYKWQKIEISNPDFSNATYLEFGFRWFNNSGISLNKVGMAIDDVRLAGDFDIFNITNSTLTDSVCSGSSITVNVDISDTLCVGTFQLFLSDDSGSFADSTSMGVFNIYFPGMGPSLSINIPTTIPDGACYKFRVDKISPPAVIGTPGDCFAIINCPATITTNPVSVTFDTNAVCIGSNIEVSFYSNGTFSSNVYKIELSDSNGVFPTSPPYNILGSLASDNQFILPYGVISGQISAVPNGCNYYIRVTASSPLTYGTTFGPFCIRACDINFNNGNDLRLCLTPNTSPVDTTVLVDINFWDSTTTYLPGNKFSIELRSYNIYPFSSWNFINLDSLGFVYSTTDSSIQLTVPPLSQLVSMGINPGKYYARVVASNPSNPDHAFSNVIFLVIGAPKDIPPVVTPALYPDTVPIDSICTGELVHFYLHPPHPNQKSIYHWNSPMISPSFIDVNGNTGGSLLLNFGTGFAGPFSIYVKESNFGCLAQDSTLVNLEIMGPPGFMGGISTYHVCLGDSVNMYIFTTGFVDSIQWKKGSVPLTDGLNFSGTNTSTLVIDSVTFVDGGNYFCEISGPCGTNSKSLNLLIHSPPDSSVSIFGDSLVANYSATGTSYQWVFCNTMIHVAGANNRTFVPPVPDDYAVIVTKVCQSISECQYAGWFRPEALEENLNIYPNPGKNKVTVEWTMDGIVKLEIFNILGARMESLIINGDSKLVTLNVSQLPSGLYVLKLFNGKDEHFKQFVIED